MMTEDATLLQRTSLEGISMWSRWQPDRALFFNSFFIRGGENVIVDPLALEERDLEAIRAEGGAAWIVITTRDHERETASLAQRLGRFAFVAARRETNAKRPRSRSGSARRSPLRRS